jgi:hypothetical protein
MWQFTETLGEGAYGEYVDKGSLFGIGKAMSDSLGLFWQKMLRPTNLPLSK